MMIRDLCPLDEDAWKVLWEGYLAFYQTELSEEQTELTWARLLDPLEHVRGLAAEVDGQLCGFSHMLVHRSTWAKVGYGYLEDLFVHPDDRGQGIARALIEAVYHQAEAEGLSRVYWVTAADNPARKLYDRLGKESGFVQYRHPVEP